MGPVAELAEIRSCGDGCLNHPFSALLIEDFDCLLHSRVFVNYCPDRFYHRDRMIVLPDVSTHVDSHRAFVHRVVHELEDVALSFEFGPPATTRGTGHPFTTFEKSGSQ